jgi:excisionase family DNA binding protein
MEAVAFLQAENSNEPLDERAVTVAAAAERLGCDKTTVRALVRRGLLTAFRIGKSEHNPRAVRIKLWSIQEWEQCHRIAPVSEVEQARRRVSPNKQKRNQPDEDADARLKAMGA